MQATQRHGVGMARGQKQMTKNKTPLQSAHARSTVTPKTEPKNTQPNKVYTDDKKLACWCSATKWHVQVRIFPPKPDEISINMIYMS